MPAVNILDMVGERPNAAAGRVSKNDGKPTKRTIEVGRARVAGFHGDSATFVRCLVERVTASEAAIREAYRQGARQKAAGVRCDCWECKA